MSAPRARMSASPGGTSFRSSAPVRDEINKGFDLMHAGESIRSVVVY